MDEIADKMNQTQAHLYAAKDEWNENIKSIDLSEVYNHLVLANKNLIEAIALILKKM